MAVQLGQMEFAVRISEYANMHAPSFLDERHKRFEQVAQLALGVRTEDVLSEGLALGPEQMWAEATTLAQAAADARNEASPAIASARAVG